MNQSIITSERLKELERDQKKLNQLMKNARKMYRRSELTIGKEGHSKLMGVLNYIGFTNEELKR